MSDLLCDYMLSISFFSLKRHGFMKSHSCVTKLLAAADKQTANLVYKGKVDVIYLDFSKDIDRVNHRCLIDKLKPRCVQPPLIDWPTSRLDNRLSEAGKSLLFLRLRNVLVGSSRVHYQDPFIKTTFFSKYCRVYYFLLMMWS